VQVEVLRELLSALRRVEEGAYGDRVQQSVLGRNPRWDRAGRSEFVSAFRLVLEQRRRLDWILERRLRRRPRPLVIQALRLGLALLEAGRPAHAVLDRLLQSLNAVSEAERGLVNGVLRGLRREPEEPRPEHFEHRRDWLCVRHSIPGWFHDLLERLETRPLSDQDLAARLGDLREGRRTWFRVNPSLWTAERAVEFLNGEGLGAGRAPEDRDFLELDRPPAGGLDEFAPLADGRLRIQDLSASGALRLLEPREGQRVLDLCAAPGGKALALSDRFPGIELCLVDVDEGRVRALERRMPPRLRIECADDRDFDEAGWDRLLLDLPCSGSGSAGQRPDILLKDRDPVGEDLLKLQAELLEHAAGLLNPGGRLVYSTCSLDPRENGEQAAAFLVRHPEFHPVPGSTPLEGLDEPGGWSWIPWRREAGSRPAGRPGAGGAWAIALERR